jgi:hypothetical protein
VVVPVTRWGRRSLLIGLLVLAAAASGCSGDEPEAEERPVLTTVSGRNCGKDVIDDWFVDGRVDRSYRLHCYDVAVDMLALDDPRFMTIRDDLRRARGAAAGRTRAAAASDGFWSPTRNIACWGFTALSRAQLRCDIVKHSWRAPPGSCGPRRTAIFTMTGVGTPRTICPNDFVPPKRVAAYGSTWRLGPFTCAVRRSGVTCRNLRGRGWFLSRGTLTLYR